MALSIQTALGRGALTGLLFAAAIEVTTVTLGRNFHVVVPGQVYRSSQLTAEDLRSLINVHGIRTVINLRGCSIPLNWYAGESRTTHALNVSQEDIAFSANRFPSVIEVRRLVTVLDRTEYPVLFHCRQGADRTGLAAAVYLMLQQGRSLGEARAQLALRLGHVPLDRAGFLDRFLDRYADWLENQGASHSPSLFRRWIESDFCPGECRCDFQLLEAPGLVAAAEHSSIRVRIRNTGLTIWHFRPGNSAGNHCVFMVTDANNIGVTSGRFGLMDKDVEPGDSVELTLVVPPLRSPGRYRMLVDMVDESHCWFHQAGNEPLEMELDVHE